MTSPSKKSEKKKSLFRWFPRRTFIVLLLLGVGIWFSPAIVAHTPLRHWVAHQIFSGVRGDITVGEASLGWLSPVVVRNVQVHDEDGNLLLEMPKVESSKSLWQLASDMSNLGLFRCEQPVLWFMVGKDRSNAEKVLAGYLEPSQSLSGMLAVDVDVNGAKIHIKDKDGSKQWQLELVDFFVSLPANESAPLRIKCAAQIPATNGKINGEIILPGMPGAAAKGQASVDLELTNVPLAIAESVVRRLDATAHLKGMLQGNIKANWTQTNKGIVQAKVKGQLTGTNIQVATSLLGTDQIHLQQLQMPCQFELDGTKLKIQQAEVICDAGKATVMGDIDLNGGVEDWLQQKGLSVAADVNLAKAAALAPSTLRLRESTNITKGRAVLMLQSLAAGGNTVWEGTLKSSDLQGVAQGQAFTWNEPLSVHFRGRVSTRALPVIEQLHCKSSFLNVKAASEGREWVIAADYDLDSLAQKISQFVDMKGIRLAGKGESRITFRAEPNDGFQLEGLTTLRKLEVAGLSKHPIREQSVALNMSAKGTATTADVVRIQTGDAWLTAGNDKLHMHLAEPMQPTFTNLNATSVVSVEGDLRRWQKRLGPWIPALNGMQANGHWEMAARCRLNSQHVDVLQARMILNNVDCQGYGLYIQEPRLEVQTKGQLDFASGRMSLRDVDVQLAAASLRMAELEVMPTSSGAIQVVGAGDIQGDLGRLQNWIQHPASATDFVGGRVSGKVALQSVSDKIRLRVNLDGNNVTLGAAGNPYWREPVMQLNGAAIYDPNDDTLQIQDLHVAGAGVQCVAAGELKRMTTTQDLNLSGKLHYDMKKLEPALRSYVGNGLDIKGTGERPFYLRGNLSAMNAKTGYLTVLQGEAAADWSEAQAYGAHCGPADVNVYLNKGWLVARPIQATINNGKLRLQPALRLEPGPMEVYLTKGKVVDHAHITPEMCSSGIKYVLPALAGLTEGDGELSLSVNGARIPIDAPTKADVDGQITIHRARVGASPLIRELATLLNRPAQAQVRPQSVVNFRMIQGRVYHDKLELVFPDLTVQTSGWVGLDGSVDMVAQFPVPQKWLGSGKISAALAKQTITIPLTGNISQPRLDAQALRQANQQLLRNAAGNVLRNELDNRLKKLLNRDR